MHTEAYFIGLLKSASQRLQAVQNTRKLQKQATIASAFKKLFKGTRFDVADAYRKARKASRQSLFIVHNTSPETVLKTLLKKYTKGGSTAAPEWLSDWGKKVEDWTKLRRDHFQRQKWADDYLNKVVPGRRFAKDHPYLTAGVLSTVIGMPSIAGTIALQRKGKGQSAQE